LSPKQADIQTRLIVGFEIHVQLATRTKLFCGCEVVYGQTPNTRLCPVCLALPGALPVINRRAFELSVVTAMALNCRIASSTKWDRKSYYYPDLPKNYQISQYNLPLSCDGAFDIVVDGSPRRIGIIRAHLEEDAGKNVHIAAGCSLVDLNRAGTPLLEIVTKPDITSAEEAGVFCTELHKLVTYLGVSRGDMQYGQMRFEPNVNVAITVDGAEVRTPISEIMNLNSFRSVRAAIEFEYRRQVQDWLNDPGYVLGDRPNENRGWDDHREVTVFQRGKEQAHDYRYFPEPDLAPVAVDETWLNELRSSVPELPAERRARLVADNGLSDGDVGIIVADRTSADLFEQALSMGAPATVLAKQFVNIWSKIAKDRNTRVAALGIEGGRMSELATMVSRNTLSATAASRVAARMLDSDGSVAALADEMGLLAVLDTDQTRDWVDEAFSTNAKAVADALSNPKKAKAACGFLRGQVMKASGGKANPKLVGELIEVRLAKLRGE